MLDKNVLVEFLRPFKNVRVKCKVSFKDVFKTVCNTNVLYT